MRCSDSEDEDCEKEEEGGSPEAGGGDHTAYEEERDEGQLPFCWFQLFFFCFAQTSALAGCRSVFSDFVDKKYSNFLLTCVHTCPSH
jgi:hypothetical protein